MTVEAEIQVYGLRESLKVLRDLDPEMRRQAVKDLKGAGAPMATIARENYPGFVPLSGWSRSGRLGYDPSKVARGVQVQVGGRQPRGADSFAVITLIQKNAGGALFDLAGLRGGSRPGRNGPRPSFLEALAQYGNAQRGMWRSVRRIRETAYTEMVRAAEKVAASASRKLVA